MKRMNKILSSITALLLLINTVCLPYTYADDGTVTVSSKDDFLKLIKECVSDTASKNKQFILSSDIDFGGEKIEPIEIFCGSFKGGGHTIKNFKMEVSSKTTSGLFKKLSAEATVSDLYISGTITSKNGEKKDLSGMSMDTIINDASKNISALNTYEKTVTDSAVGGLAGENNGIISNCSFSGSIDGENVLGGIVGVNNNSGTVDRCLNTAKINGDKVMGGIAGNNYGLIKQSKNTGLIAPDAKDYTTNVGGIAGYNEGVIEGSYNEGNIGCDGFGTNIGGIAGKQSGCIIECENKNSVTGKKNVGGITGIFVPYSDIDISEEGIKKEIERMNSDIKDSVKSIETDIKNNVDDTLSGLGGFAGLLAPLFTKNNSSLGSALLNGLFSSGSSSDIAQSVKNVLDSFAYSIQNPHDSSLNTALARGSENLLNSLSESINSHEGVDSSAVNDLINSIRNSVNSSSERLDRNSDKLGETADKISENSKYNSESFRNAIDKVSGNIESNSDIISQSINDASTAFSDNMDRLSDSTIEDFNNLNTSLCGTMDAMTDLLDRIDTTRPDIDRVLDSLSNSLDSSADNKEEISSAIVDILRDIDLSNDSVDRLINSLTKSIDNVNSLIESIKKDLGEVADAVIKPFEVLRELLNNALKYFQNIKNDLAEIREKIVSLQEYIDKILQTIGSKKIASALKITVMSAKDFLFPSVYAEEKKTLSDIIDSDAVRDELQKMISVDITLDRKVAGQYSDNALIKYCINSGDVSAGTNAGGIAGLMGVESVIKEGSKLSLPNGKSVLADTAVKAVIDSCIDSAEISAKSKNAGGIAGDANVGIIKDCLSTGDINTGDGGYAGGICANAGGSILTCIAISDLEGSSDLGGIAGKGNNIKYCYALPRFDADTPRSGAIAGSADNTVYRNYFIDEGLGGVGGASYTDGADALKHDKMTAADGNIPADMVGFSTNEWYMEKDDLYLPQLRALAENDGSYLKENIRALSHDAALFHFKVAFEIEGVIQNEMTFEYGDIIPSDKIPELTAKDGEYPHWNKDVTAPIVRNTIFKAEFDKAVTTISTGEKPPVLLAEGNFDENSKITVAKTDLAADFSGYEKGQSYSFTITPQKDAQAGFKLHVRDESKKGVALGIIKNGTAQIIECERDGSYLVCELNQSGDIVILNKPQSAIKFIIVLAVLLIIISVSVMLFIKIKKKKKEHTLEPKS